MGTSAKANVFEIKIEIPTAAVEEMNEILLELGNEAWSLLEDVIANRAWVVGIFPTLAIARGSCAELRSLSLELPLGQTELRELLDSEWRDSYKAHFHAWQFGRLHWVPIWERGTFHLPQGDAVLWLDPGLAFGTGNHETTRLCVERLVDLAARKGTGGHVLDAGCGSGILALSAAKLGFNQITGFDNDPEVVRVSKENAVLNGLDHKAVFFVGDLGVGLAHVQADVLLANILADLLMRFARELTAAVAPGGALVLSGILATECDQVRTVFSAIVPDWLHESRVLGEWSDIMLLRPAGASTEKRYEKRSGGVRPINSSM